MPRYLVTRTLQYEIEVEAENGTEAVKQASATILEDDSGWESYWDSEYYYTNVDDDTDEGEV